VNPHDDLADARRRIQRSWSAYAWIMAIFAMTITFPTESDIKRSDARSPSPDISLGRFDSNGSDVGWNFRRTIIASQRTASDLPHGIFAGVRNDNKFAVFHVFADGAEEGIPHRE
jgi:hypothetical protein